MCAFGAPFQKYTTLAHSAGLAPLLDSLDRLRCNHTSHASQVGGEQADNGKWTSAGAVPEQHLTPLTSTSSSHAACA
eukprot:2865358-Prymnesium_polylepis.1